MGPTKVGSSCSLADQPDDLLSRRGRASARIGIQGRTCDILRSSAVCGSIRTRRRVFLSEGPRRLVTVSCVRKKGMINFELLGGLAVLPAIASPSLGR